MRRVMPMPMPPVRLLVDMRVRLDDAPSPESSFAARWILGEAMGVCARAFPEAASMRPAATIVIEKRDFMDFPPAAGQEARSLVPNERDSMRVPASILA